MQLPALVAASLLLLPSLALAQSADPADVAPPPVVVAPSADPSAVAPSPAVVAPSADPNAVAPTGGAVAPSAAPITVVVAQQLPPQSITVFVAPSVVARDPEIPPAFATRPPAAGDSLAPRDASRGSRVARVAVEALAGAGGAAVGGMTGALTGYLVGFAFQPPGADVPIGPILGLVAGGGIGGALGIGLAVYGAGQAMDGDGGIGWTLLGDLAGSVAGFAGGLLTQDASAVVGLLALGSLAGSVLGYELSSHESRREARAQARDARRASALRVIPQASADPRGGATVGVAGMF